MIDISPHMRVIRRVQKSMQAHSNYVLVVGVIGEAYYDNGMSVQEIATIHKYDHYTPTGAFVPARDFIGMAVKNGSERWTQMLRSYALKYVNRKTKSGIPTGMITVGRLAASEIRDIIVSRSMLEPNAPLTIRRKGFDFPLVDDRLLLNSISFRIQHAGK